MGVYIDMEMPKDCLKCPFCLFADGYWKCLVDGSHADFGGICRPQNCPLVQVPTTHGRLGDLSALAERLEDLRKTTAKENPPTDNHGFNNGIMCGIGAAINEVRYYTPTIIPAEEGE